MLYTHVEKCRICKNSDLYKFLDLGKIPLPNEFIDKKNLKKNEIKYPLSVAYCKKCSLVQLMDIVKPSAMFKNYLYIPSSSKTRINHFKAMAEYSVKYFNLNRNSLVVDIGSNDGSLLNCFKNMDIKVVGIDPAENLVKVAELNGIPTILGYINDVSVQKVVRKYGKANLILATNVVAHIDNLYGLMESVNKLLDKNGIFITQFPYLLDLLEKNQFDTIYHEHLSYFSLQSLMYLSVHGKMEIFDIARNDLDGGSLRVFWKKKSNNTSKIKKSKIKYLLKIEKDQGLFETKTYDVFAKRIKKLKIEVRSVLKRLRKQGKHIVGYGAAAKGNILLNYFGIDTDILDYLVDSTPYKQGLYTPGTHIPIYEESKIYVTDPDYLFILAWNFIDEIIAKNSIFRKKSGKFIVPNPSVHIVE